MQFQRLKSSELFKVSSEDQGCEMEIFFYRVDVLNFNMIFTGGYLNPVATNDMLLKIMNAANQYDFMDSIGFVGVFNNDNFTTVKECIKKAFKILLKRIKLIDKQQKEINEINQMSVSDIISKYFDNSPPKPPQAAEPEPSLYSRILRKRKPKEELVDLTETEDENLKRSDDEVSDDFFFETCCSELLDDENDDFSFNKYLSSWGHQAEKAKPHEVAFVDVRSWLLKEKFEKYPEEYPVNDPLAEQQETLKRKENDERIFTKNQRTAAYSTENKASISQRSQSDTRPLRNTSAMVHYLEKADRDFNKPNTSQNNQQSPQLGRGWTDRNQKLVFDIRRKSKLLDDKDFDDLNSQKQKRSVDQAKVPKFSQSQSWFQIPKKDKRSPERGFSQSVVSKSPMSDYKRRPIHEHPNTTERYPTRSEKILANLKLPGISSPKVSALSARSQSQHQSVHVTELVGQVEIINLDKEDEDENNDSNNNRSESRKRALYNPVQAPTKPYKIFTTKTPKPSFGKKLGERQ